MMSAGGRPATGVSAWAMGFVVLLPIPLLGPLAAGGAMVAAYGSLSRQGPLAKANAAAARRWGRFFLIAQMALVVLHLLLLLPRLGGTQEPAGFFPLGIPLVLYLLLCAVHLAVVIVATVQARRGEAVRLPFTAAAS